jgi:ADP-heptose:LPS heptosyltransferase
MPLLYGLAWSRCFFPVRRHILQETSSMLADSAVQRVLVYRLGSLGDTTVAFPALHLVARAFPRARRVMLTNFPVHAKAPAAAAVLGDSGLVHGYMRYTAGTRNPLELFALMLRIRRYRPDLLVYLTPPRGKRAVERDAAFFRLCGIRRIVGLPVGDQGRSLFDPATGLYESEAARMLRLIRPLGQADANDLANWDLHLTADERARSAAALEPLGGRPFLACCPGTKMQAKEWGRDKWRELLGRLSARFPGYGLALIGAREDAEVADYTGAAWKGPRIQLCGQLTPRQSAAVIGRAQLFLGPDSGPMHLAAAQGVPLAIAFAAIDWPGRWFLAGPRNRYVYHHVDCAGCRLQTCIEKKKICIDSITVDEMEQAALEAIGRQAE